MSAKAVCAFIVILFLSWHTVRCDVSADSWMTELQSYIYNYSLLEITLPGTHDSGMYYYQNAVGPEESEVLDEMITLATKFHIPLYSFIGDWSVAQETTFFEQLMGGIRHLDLRACIYQGQWYTEHFLIGVPTQTLLDDIKRFFANNSHSGEVMVVQVGDLSASNFQNQTVLIDMIQNTLGPWLAVVPPNGFQGLTIGQMVRNKQQIVIIYPSAGSFPSYNFLWDTGRYIEGSYANMDNLAKMTEWNVGEINENGGRGKLFQLSWTLTTQNSDIEKTILDPFVHPRTLKELALIADGALINFANTYSNYKMGNLLLVDFWDSVDVVSLAIHQNVRMCNDDPAYIAVNPNGQYCRQYISNGNCTNLDLIGWMTIHCRLSCGFC